MVLTDVQWVVLEGLVEARRLHRNAQFHGLRHRAEAIIWRFQSGARWRAMPAEYGSSGRTRRLPARPESPTTVTASSGSGHG